METAIDRTNHSVAKKTDYHISLKVFYCYCYTTVGVGVYTIDSHSGTDCKTLTTLWNGSPIWKDRICSIGVGLDYYMVEGAIEKAALKIEPILLNEDIVYTYDRFTCRRIHMRRHVLKFSHARHEAESECFARVGHDQTTSMALDSSSRDPAYHYHCIYHYYRLQSLTFKR